MSNFLHSILQQEKNREVERKKCNYPRAYLHKQLLRQKRLYLSMASLELFCSETISILDLRLKLLLDILTTKLAVNIEFWYEFYSFLFLNLIKIDKIVISSLTLLVYFCYIALAKQGLWMLLFNEFKTFWGTFHRV